MSKIVLPYDNNASSKKAQVSEMFDNISANYDFLNHFLSLGIDKLWRKTAIKILKKENPKIILDVATGTGDFAFEALNANPDQVIGIDISEGMLEQGRQKINKAGLNDKIQLYQGDSENINYDDNFFDAVIVAFGVRNFENLNLGLDNMRRVLKPNGMLIILEFSKPQNFIFKGVYNFYFKYLLPVVGKAVSKDARAYTYLPESVDAFPYGSNFVNIIKSIGFNSVVCKPLTFGISSLYICKK